MANVNSKPVTEKQIDLHIAWGTLAMKHALDAGDMKKVRLIEKADKELERAMERQRKALPKMS
jgi:hypothetical protein